MVTKVESTLSTSRKDQLRVVCSMALLKSCLVGNSFEHDEQISSSVSLFLWLHLMSAMLRLQTSCGLS